MTDILAELEQRLLREGGYYSPEHQGRPGMVGGSLPAATGGGSMAGGRKTVSEHMARLMPDNPGARKFVTDVLERSGVPGDHLGSLKMITTDLSKRRKDCDCMEVAGSWVIKPERLAEYKMAGYNLNEKSTIAGFVTYSGKAIFLNRLEGLHDHTICHELGHWVVRSQIGKYEERANMIAKGLKMRSGGGTHWLTDLGLRPHSVSNGGELLADAYAIRCAAGRGVSGAMRQYNALREHCKDNGINLNSIFRWK